MYFGNWEGIDRQTSRLKVFEGWIILHRSIGESSSVESESMVYIFDPDHRWKLEVTK